jgi:hypothetical protein
MKKERILSYKLSQKITEEELESLSVAGGTSHGTGGGTYSPGGGSDGQVDWVQDF